MYRSWIPIEDLEEIERSDEKMIEYLLEYDEDEEKFLVRWKRFGSSHDEWISREKIPRELVERFFTESVPDPRENGNIGEDEWRTKELEGGDSDLAEENVEDMKIGNEEIVDERKE